MLKVTLFMFVSVHGHPWKEVQKLHTEVALGRTNGGVGRVWKEIFPYIPPYTFWLLNHVNMLSG